MTKENVGGIFFTEQEKDFGKLFNEFNIYMRNLDSDMGTKEVDIFNLDDLPKPDSVVQALDSYTSKNLDDLKTHFRSLNDAFDSVEGRIQSALDRLLT
tara:strand:- start:414 stop:707 length:294 start_codon:yes stop_codon:yes gene_type:complete